MKKLLVALSVVALSGCAMIPSFWDDNQSHRAVDIWQSAKSINCDGHYRYQVINLADNMSWFVLYSEAKGTKDVLEIAEKMNETVKPFAEKKELSPAYCKLKQRILDKQGEALAKSVLGRF